MGSSSSHFGAIRLLAELASLVSFRPRVWPLWPEGRPPGVQEALGYAYHDEIQKEVEAGRLLAPRMVIGTRWVSGPMPSDPESKAEILVANEADARHAVVDAKNYGADFIEVSGIENLPREAFFALADEAKKRGISLQGDVPVFVSLEEASNAGLRSINPLPAVIQEEILAAYSSRENGVFAIRKIPTGLSATRKLIRACGDHSCLATTLSVIILGIRTTNPFEGVGCITFLSQWHLAAGSGERQML